MARIEKTVFISYRRTDVYTALAVYENLKNQGYDVFFDYRSISSGDFEQIITSNIRARAHFILVLTPTALDRCNEPGDWLRREIELAIDEKRNIVPLFFKGFRFGTPSVSKQLTGKLKNISRYNGLNVHEDYFDEAMQRVRTQFLSKPLDTVLHPVSTEVRKVVREEQIAADEALKDKENVKNVPVKQAEEKPVEKRELPEPVVSKPEKAKVASSIPMKAIPWRKVGGVAGIMAVIALFVWAGTSVWSNLSNKSTTEEPDVSIVFTQAALTVQAQSNQALTKTPSPITSALGIGSTMTGKDGMTLLYVPAGEFTMGSEDGGDDEKPVHTVFLDAFWIDQTEVTNAMYAKCVTDGQCDPPNSVNSYTHDSYYDNSEFDNYPVIYVLWDDANKYCSWADRRLPTEVEWEAAARGTDANIYPWGDDAPNNDLLNYNSAVGDTTEAGNYPSGASPYGALDMAGNVWEWVDDWYDSSYYSNSPSSNPQGPTSGQYRVLRGGSWFSNNNNVVRSANRHWAVQRMPATSFGFRCSRSP